MLVVDVIGKEVRSNAMTEHFEILPEEAAPREVQQCERCELAKQRARVIWGEGNPSAPIMLIMDNPGAREDRDGRAFVCGTRETLQRGLREAGIDTASVYVTYLLKCRPIRAYDKPAAREACSPHLDMQATEQRPLVAFGFGNVVAEALLPHLEGATVKELRGTWQDWRGVPLGFTYHPLAVRRRPNLMRIFVEDLVMLRGKLDHMQSRNVNRAPT